MDYREFVEKHTGLTDMTLDYSFPLTKEHVQAQAGVMRKIFSNKAVKQDMNDFVQWQLTGYAEINDDAMRACFENGASKEMDAESLAIIVAGCTTEISDLTKDLMQVNGISIKDLHKEMAQPLQMLNEYGQDTIIHCLNLGMPQELVAQFHTKGTFMETLIAYDFSKENIKGYMLNNHHNPFDDNNEDNCAAQLLAYGFTANDLIDMTPNTAATFSNPDNCQVILDLGATPEHIAKSVLFPSTEAPDETIKLLIANGIAIENLTDRYEGKTLDRFCVQLERIGVEPKFSEKAITEFSYTQTSKRSISERLFNEVEKTMPFSEDLKEKFLLAAFKTFDNKAIDFLVSKGAEIKESHIVAMIGKLSQGWGESNDLEQAAVEVVQNVAINHNVKLSTQTQRSIIQLQKKDGLDLKNLRATVQKVEFNQNLERKLPPREQKIPLATKVRKQGMKI